MKERCYTDNTYYPTTTIPDYNLGHYETCKCCCGSGVQRKCDGVRIICPCCNGSGKRWVSGRKCYPSYPRRHPVIWSSSGSTN